MNFIIEGNNNFSEQLMKMLTEEENHYENVCLISGDKLTDNFIKLDCGHTFNYTCLINELVNQRKKNRLETQKTTKYQIKCPYCRNNHMGIMPWYEGYRKILNVNWNEKKEKKENTCIALLKSGKRKGKQCNCISKYGNYCGKHKKYFDSEVTN